MIPPADLVAIPPVVRTVIYYLIAEAIIVCTAVSTGLKGWELAGSIASGNAILFFGTAAAKVNKAPTAEDPVPVTVVEGDPFGEDGPVN